MSEPEWAAPDETPPLSFPGEWVTLDDFYDIPLPKPSSSNGAYADGGDEYEDDWTPINLATLPDTPPLEPTLGGVGLVYPGKRHVFSGPQESAKTLAAYAIGLEVVRAGGFLILIDFEMGRYDARNRLRELGATDTDLKRIGYLEPHRPAHDRTMLGLIGSDPTLVIIDAAAGAYDLQGLDDNKRQDVERFTSLYVRDFWRHEIATIVIDHVVKNTDNRGKYAIGSERKVGGADVHLGFETITPISRGGTGLYKVVNHKDRGGFLQRGKLATLELSSNDAHAISWAFRATEHVEPPEQWLPTALMTKVSVYLSTLREPVPRKQIVTEVQGRKDVIRRAIDFLVRLGYATETAGERGAKLVEHERLFHENDLPKPVDNSPGGHVAPRSPDVAPGHDKGDVATWPHPFRGTGHVAPPPEQQKMDDVAPTSNYDDDIPF